MKKNKKMSIQNNVIFFYFLKVFDFWSIIIEQMKILISYAKMKKTLNRIMIVMLIFMELATPMTYAYDFSDVENSEVVEDVVEEVEETVVEDIEDEEIVDDVDEEEGGDEDENTDENDEEQTTEDVNNEGWSDAEVNTWDTTEINTWDTTEVNTWDTTEINTWDTTEINTWDTTEVNTWDTTEVNTWDTTEVNTWDTTEVNTWDTTEINTWDTTEVNTWDTTEINTWDTTEVNTWDTTEINTWDTTEVNTWDIEDFTGDIVEINEWLTEDDINELVKAIENLNEEEIVWQDANDDVILDIKAPIWSFIEGTELRIVPITWDEQLEEIRNNLLENTSVDKDSEFVAFDVSFVYTLSNWKKIELPALWKDVRLSFNYTYNDVLSSVDWDNDRELKVYHLAEIRDEEWKKTWEIDVEKIETLESRKWELVVNARNFSVYVIVSQDKDESVEEEPLLRSPMLKAISLRSVEPEWIRDNTKWSIYLQFNANGWTFSGSYTTKNIEYGWYNRDEVRYAHTSNHSDWQYNSNTVYTNNDIINNDTGIMNNITIEWAVGLSINLLYWIDFGRYNGIFGIGANSFWETLTVYSWNWIRWPIIREYIWTGSYYSNWWIFWGTSRWVRKWSENFSVNSNSVTFSFKTNRNSLNDLNITWFWYYATITWTVPVWWRTADSIEEPTRTWYEFVDWYTDANYTTGFDEEHYDFISWSRIIYAKWTCAWWYTEVWWECKQDCTVPASLWWGTIHHGQSVTWYQSDTVPHGQTCQSEARTCNNGTLSWSYTYSGCRVLDPVGCTLPWWGTAAHNSIATWYTTSSAICPNPCVSATATCNNGVWSVNNFTWTYTNQTCTISADSCDSSYTLSFTWDNWTYESCTSYTVSSNICNPWSTVYKLTNCDSGYHTEDNGTCVSNSKHVACDEDLVPVNSTAISGDVIITWNWTWNDWSWSDTWRCDWFCNEHYHTWENNTSCELDTYHITWKNYNGIILESEYVGYWLNPSYDWETPEKPSDETYRYVFNWWTPAVATVTWDAVYTATFSANELSESAEVTFNTNGWSNVESQVVSYGWRVRKPSNPTKTGFAFDYWSTDVDWDNEYNFNTEVTWDLILYAQWTENVCTVSFQNGYCYRNKGNDRWIPCGYTLSDPIYVKCGSTISRSDTNEPTEPYRVSQGNRVYYFARWSTTEDPWLTNNSTTFNFSTPITSDIILYAIWGDPSYNITFHWNWWNPSSYTVTVWVYGLVKRPDDPVKEGYTLKCWSENSSDSSCSNPYIFDAEENRVTADNDLYAQWSPITYTVKYYANGWEWSMSDTNMTYNTSGNLAQNTFTKTNATFVEWNTKANGSWTPYSGGQSVNNLTTTTWTVIRLYAQWNCNTWYQLSGDVCVASDCTFQWQTIKNGSGLTVYSSASETCPNECVEWIVTCTDGQLWWNTGYTNLSCTTQDVQCSVSDYPLTTCPAHWVCNTSCTPYTVSDNSCEQWTTRYALDSCDDHYHKDWNTCKIDTHIITFVNYNWVELLSSEYDYGTLPENIVRPSTPSKPWTPRYSYSFSGWNPEVTTVVWAQVYTATYTSTINTYTITWLDWDWEVLDTDQVEYDAMPSYTGPTPTKTATARTGYTFNNTWTPTVATVTWAATYTANFDETVNQYTVTITVSPDGYGTLSQASVTDDYGSTISINNNVLTISWTNVTATPIDWRPEYTYIFTGWTNNCGNELTGDCEIIANFDRAKIEYTATFNSNWGSAVASQTKPYWSTFNRPADPTKDGYDFVDWYADSGLNLVYNFNDSVTQTLALYAKWTPHVYTIGYTLNWGSVSPANPTSYTIESWNFTLNNPTRTWYEFKWWTWTKLGGLTETVTITQWSTGDRTYVANWEAVDVKVTIRHYIQDLDAANNQVLGTYTLYTSGTTEEEADSMIQLANYKLTNIEWFTYSEWKVGWETVIQTRVLPEWTLVIDLYYTRNSNAFTLTTDAGSKTNWTSPSGQYYYDAIITLSGSATDCYMWNRWAVQWVTLANNQQQTTFTMPNNNVSAESLVTQKTYNIAFNGNGHTSWEMPTMEGVLCTATVPLTANGFVKTWYTFTWWSETNGWAKAYDDGQNVQTLTTENWATVTLYAIWDANKNTPYTVNHWYLGVNGERTSDKITDNLSWTTNTKVTPAVKWREWFNSPDPAEITISPEGNTVLDYEYRRIYYPLTFVTTGTQPDSRNVIYGWALNVDETSAISGYTFLWWSPNPTGMTMQIGGVELTATWSANTNTPYKVEHYRQNLENDNYTKHETENKTGTTDTTATATPKTTYEWFTYNPSDPRNEISGNIDGRGTLVLKVYYTRNVHTITFVTNGGTNIPAITAKYGSWITPPADPTKDGYDFVSWDDTIPSTMPDDDITITAQWTPHTYTIAYTLNEWALTGGKTNPTSYTIESNDITLNNPERTGYTFLGWTRAWHSTPTTNVTIWQWSTGNRVYVANWEANNNIRLTVNHYTQNVDADNNTVSNNYTLSSTSTFDTWTADAPITVEDYKISIEWFTYSEWKVDNVVVTETTVSPDGSRVINLYYTRNKYRFTLTTPTGSTTQGSSQTADYYYKAKVTLSGDVSSDCYMWNQWNVQWATITNNKQTTFTMPANVVSAQPSVTEKTYNIAFDGNTNTSWTTPTMNGVACTATVTLNANGFVKTWYTFTGWSLTVWWAKAYSDQWSATTLTTENGATVTLHAIWEANTDTAYTVVHKKQNINDNNYSEVGREPLSWITDENATVTVRPYEGFEAWVYTPATIKWDWSTVIVVTYDRKSYTITFNENWGSEVDDITARYEEAITQPDSPEKQGYEFSGWNPGVPATMPAYSQTINAEWRPANVNYTVEHHLQSITNDQLYELSWVLTEPKQWKTESQTEAAAKDLHWFTAQSFNQETILPDGSTKVIIYYTRDSYTVTFNSNWGSEVSSVTAKYQSWIAAPTAPTKEGYTFTGWYDSGDNKVTFPYEVEDNVTLTAHWDINKYRITFDYNGGTGTPAYIEQDYGTAITAPADPTREGFTFGGWSGSIPATMPAKNQTITALWNINSYKIRFVDWSWDISTVEHSVVYDASTSSISHPNWEKEGYSLSWSGSIPATMPAHDVVITGNWIINQYTITFNTTWSAVDPIKQNYNTTIDEEPQTTQHGYTFTGWYDSGDNKVTFPYTIPAADETLTAHWDINQYTITFDSRWGSAVASVTRDYLTQIPAPTAPTKNGYSFKWWYDSGDNKVIFPYTIRDSETLHAVWDVVSYTLSYNLNWGSVEVDNPTRYTVESNDITLNNPTRVGYNFLWWTWTDVPTYNSGVVITWWSTGNRSYVANWQAIEYTISYELNWGTVATANPSTYTIESSNITLNNPTKAGYTFLWWTGTDVSTYNSSVVITWWSIGNRSYVANWQANTNTPYKVEHYQQNLENDNYTLFETGNHTWTTDTTWYAVANTYVGFTYDSTIPGTVTSGNIDGNGNLVLKLYYTRNVHTITFVTSGGTNIPVITAKYGSWITPPADPTKDGYDFVSWDDTIPSTMPDDDITITAQWTPHTYTIAYTLNEWALTGGKTNPTSYTIESNDITLNNPERTGYTFLWWTLAWESNPSTNVTIAKWSTGDRTYVANWSINQYRITFDYNGWTGTPVYIEQDYGTAITAPADPTRNGYTFTGWSPSVPATMPDEDMTVVAQWDIVTYHITYDLDGGELAQWVTNPATYTVETNTFRLNNPTKYGYDFSGWDDGQWNISATVDITKWSTGDRNYTAVYDVHEWWLTFKSDNETISSTKVAYGSAVTAPANPTKHGYTFTGWSPSVPVTMPDNDLVINAVWEVNRHNVTYISEGQTFEQFTNIAYGDDIPTTWNTPTKVWHHFVEWTWATALNAKMPDNDVTYTAVFEKNDYVVELSASPTTWGTVLWAWTYKYDDSITVTGTANYGFTFSWWKKWNEVVSTASSYTFTAGDEPWVSLVAVFDINSYDVTVSSSDDVMWSVTWGGSYVYTTQATLTATANQWYHFVWWRDSNNNIVSSVTPYVITVTESTGFVAVFAADTNTPYTVEHYKQNIDETYPTEASEVEPLSWTTAASVTPAVKSYDGFTAPATQTVTIAADGGTVVKYYYTRNSYTITFDSNWGTSVAAITKKFDESFEKPANPTKVGYSFEGWDKTIPPKMPAENQTITAQWSINQYTITFNTNGWSIVNPITQDYDTAVTAPANPRKTGYTFSGWDREIPATMPAENITINAEWTINQYTITFDSNWGTPVAAITQDYNTAVTRPANPTRDGYTFQEWNPTVPATMPAENITLTWLWTANTNTPYKVEHYKQQLDGSYAVFETGNKVGTTDTTGTAEPNTYVWFTYDSTISGTITSWNIAWNGSLVLKLYYRRNTHTLSFDTDGGTSLNSQSLKYEEPIPTIGNTTKTWYHLSETVSDAWIGYPVDGLMPDDNLELKANWQPNTNTKYYVEHYLQNLDGTTYPAQPYETEEFEWTTDAPITPAVKTSYNGFQAPATQSTTISPEWDTVVKYYYTRKTYRVNYDANGGSDVASQDVIFGWTIPARTTTKTGYDFGGWSWLPNNSIMPDYNLDLIAIWNPSHNTPYRVEYWLEDVSGGTYTMDTGFDFTGVTNNEVSPCVYGYTWFNSPAPQTGQIKADGSLVIKYEYTRKIYELSYDTQQGTPILSPIQLKYGAQVVTWTVTRPWYTFEYWDNYPVDGKMPAKNLQLVAKWEANTNTPYHVKHYLQHLNDTWYDLDLDEPLQWTTDTDTAAAAKHYPWYTALPFSQENINWYGTTVVEIFYDRDTYKLIYDTQWGSPIATWYLKYGAEIVTWTTTKTWYVFVKWNGLPVGNVMPSEDVTLTAEWTPSTGTKYHVQHYREDIEVWEYTLHETQELSWTTNTEARPAPQTYMWFITPEVKTGIIAPDGSLVIRYDYNRSWFTLTYNVNGWAPVANNPRPVRYEVLVDTWVTTTKTWYLFSGWSNLPPEGKMPAEAWTLNAVWTPDDVNYTVQHKFQNVEGTGYILSWDLTEILTWKTESQTKAVAKNISWFTAQTITQQQIAADSSTVVEVLYTRNPYTISFNSDWGTVVESITAKYGSWITAPANPTKTGYTFNWWNPAFPATMPAKNMELVAQWINNVYTVSFDANQGQGTTASVSATYDVPFTLTANGFTRAWYTFSGWALTNNGAKIYNNQHVVTDNLTAVSWANVVLYAVWDLDTYTITYELNWGSVNWTNPTSYDITSWNITLINPTRDGYNFLWWTWTDVPTYNSGVVITQWSVGNRSYVANWQPIVYTITYDLDGWDPVANSGTYTIETNTFTLNNPEKAGYHFDGWTGTNVSTPSDNVIISKWSTWDRSYVANWTANNDTKYTVKHYKQNINDNGYTLAETEELSGTTDTLTNAQAKTYQWFTVQAFSQKTIKADDSDLIEIYYDRINYTISVDWNRWIESVVWTWSYRYGKSVTVTVNVKPWYTIDTVEWHKDYSFTVTGDYTITPTIDVVTYNITYELNWGSVATANPSTYNVETTFTLNNPTKTGYTFTWWTGTDLSEKTINVTVNSWSIGNRSYVANWQANTDTDYTVKHWYMNLNDQRDNNDVVTQNLDWVTAEEVTPDFISRSWFSDPAAKKTVTIAADGSTLVEYEYFRITYEVTYDTQGNIPASQWEVPSVWTWTFKYGETLTGPELIKAGYHFDGWTWAETMPVWGTQLVAEWTPIEVTYTVRHRKENANDNGYTEVLADRQTLSWVTAQQTVAAANTYPGFTALTITQAEIMWNGSTIIDVYYSRREYTITFDSWSGSAVDSITAKYESNLTEPTRPTLAWYIFQRWDPTFPGIMPLNGANLTAIWDANTWTQYTIKHYLADLDGNYPVEPAYTDTWAWVTAQQTAAQPRVIAWFTAVEPIHQETINWNGTTVVRIEYTRNEYEVTYDAQGNIPASQWQVTPVATWTFKYGETLTGPVLTKSGYNFDGWSGVATMPVWGAQLVAQWTPVEVTYTVKHLKAKANESGYEEVVDDRQTLSWVTEQDTEAAANTYDGFTAQTITQAEIMWDGSTVVEVYYNRNPYTLTFVTTGTQPASRDVTYGRDLNVDETSAMSGYTFLGWSPNPTGMTMPLGGLTLTATWEAHTNTPYRVEHYQENIANTGYTLFETDNSLSGTTDQLTKAEANTYPGFTAKSFDQLKINWDVDNNITVVKIYYNRNVHTVTYDSKWGTSVENRPYKYGATIQRPTNVYRSWYAFSGWSGVVTMPDNDVTLEAEWIADTTTPYIVKHYQQNITDNEYTEVVEDRQEKFGTTDQLTEAVAKTYAWFTAKSFEQLPINWDVDNNITIVEIRYDRNEYTITFETSTWTNVPEFSGRFGATVPSVENPELSWYTFKWWSPNIPETIPDHNVTLTAIWEANSNTPYKVEHYQQNIADDNYTLYYTDNLSGTTDTTATAVPNTYDGFTYSWTVEGTVTSGNIDGHGTLVLKLYYIRNSYEVSYEYANVPAGASILPSTQSYRYWQEVTVAPLATASWYDFIWDREAWSTFSMPASNVVITWTFTARNDTKYTVEYYYQQADGNYLDEPTSKDESRTTTTDTTVTVTNADKTPTLEEYAFDASNANNVLQWVVNWYGTLTLKVYFKKQFTVTYKKGTKWTFNDDVHANLDYGVATPAFVWDLTIQHAAWYTFVQWTPTVAGNVTDNAEYVAQWSANDNTEYTVKYIYKWVDDEIVDEVVDVVYTGITDSTINAPLSWKDWFIDPSVKPITIKWDGTASVTYVYERNQYWLTYDAKGGTTPNPIEVTFGALNYTWATTTRAWYDFVEWTWDLRMPVGGTTLEAIWSARTDTPYKVEHYKQNVNDNNYTLFETGNHTWITDTTWYAVANTYVWFTYDENVEWTITSGNIEWNGSLVLKLYYTRNSYNVSYEYTETVTWASELPATQSYKYEQEVTVAPLATASWYDFTWDREAWSTFNMPASGVVITWTFTARNDTKYYVEHVYKWTDDGVNDVTVVKEHTWTTDTTVNAPLSWQAWFIDPAVQQVTIHGDESGRVTYEYTRTQYELTYDGNGWTTPDPVQITYGALNDTWAETTRDGYTFVEWTWALRMPLDGTTLTAVWTANTDTPYKVEHYKQNVNDDNYTLFETGNHTWTTDTTWYAVANTYVWFTYDENVEWTITSGNIEWNGSLVLKLYYTRNSYNVSYEYTETVTWASALPATQSYKYEQEVTVAPLATAPWYDFVWDREAWSIFNMPASGVVITWIFTARNDTLYHVEHYWQNADDDEYVLHETDELSWTTDTYTQAAAHTYSWFELTWNVVQSKINGNGSTVVKIYYDRLEYSVTFDSWSGSAVAPITWRYGQTITLPEKPTLAWYTFKWWSPEFPDKIPLDWVLLTAIWEANTWTIYHVEHRLENIYDTWYTLKQTDELSWTTDTLTDAHEKIYDGFTLTWGVIQTWIKWDESTVVVIKYSRNSYTITFDTDGWTEINPITTKYQTSLTQPDDPTKTWYTFKWWSPAFPGDMPLGGLELTALWDANTWTKYTVVHIYTWTTDWITWETIEIQRHGTSDTTVTAQLAEREWFINPEQTWIYIKPDGTARVTYVYERTWYTLSYNSNWWTPVPDKTIIYGALNDTWATTTRTWYTFVQWSWDERMPLDGTTLTAVWTPNTWTTYTVKHMQEQLDGTYVLVATDELSWTTDTSVTPSVNTYEWFTAPSTQTINIDPDGNAEVVYKYSRNSYRLVIKDKYEVLVDTEVKYEDEIVLPADPVWTWHTFMWWNNVPSDGKMPAWELEITARWDVNSYTITFDTDGWTPIEPITADYGTPLTPPAAPTKDRYHFIGWDPEFPETMPAESITIKAIWARNGWSWWWWRWWWEWEHWAAEEQEDTVPEWVDPEVFDAYKWARKYWITTMDTLEEADPDGYVIRWHLAKMVVNFAVNVLWRELPAKIPAQCHWNDKESEWESAEIKMYAEQSCALWVMWIYMEEFLPNKIVDRWEFGTVLSRLLWWDKYNVIDTNNTWYYEKHLLALKDEEIMTQIDRPLSRKELRKRVWVMLRRVQLEEEKS